MKLLLNFMNSKYILKIYFSPITLDNKTIMVLKMNVGFSFMLPYLRSDIDSPLFRELIRQNHMVLQDGEPT